MQVKTGPAEPQLQRGLNEGIANRTAVQQAQQICQEAANKCNNTCQQEMIQARSTTPPQEQLAEQHNQVNQMCRQQYEQMQQTSQMALADIAALIAKYCSTDAGIGDWGIR
jgi:4-diphosphocytidyl-2C-methyl-D-erythritol kinase